MNSTLNMTAAVKALLEQGTDDPFDAIAAAHYAVGAFCRDYGIDRSTALRIAAEQFDYARAEALADD